MQVLFDELAAGIPDGPQFIRVVTRLLVATLLGAIVGYERERTGKSAGLRTHMLVALSCALFVIAPLEAGASPDDLSRVVQGVAAGIGFLGAGAILKRDDSREVQGLTTAAGIWMTAAAGVAVGMGRTGTAVVSVILTWIILAAVTRIERRG